MDYAEMVACFKKWVAYFVKRKFYATFSIFIAQPRCPMAVSTAKKSYIADRDQIGKFHFRYARRRNEIHFNPGKVDAK